MAPKKAKTAVTTKKASTAKKRQVAKPKTVTRGIKKAAIQPAKKDKTIIRLDGKALTRKTMHTMSFESGMEFTHKIIQGKYSGWIGCLRPQPDGRNLFSLLVNGRGKLTQARMAKYVELAHVRELTADETTKVCFELNGGNQEDEDTDLMKHEKETWKCPRCGKVNTNEDGYCKKTIDKNMICGGTKVPEVAGPKGWAGTKIGSMFTATEDTCINCRAKNPKGAAKCSVCESNPYVMDPRNIPNAVASGTLFSGNSGYNSGVAAANANAPVFTFGRAQNIPNAVANGTLFSGNSGYNSGVAAANANAPVFIFGGAMVGGTANNGPSTN